MKFEYNVLNHHLDLGNLKDFSESDGKIVVEFDNFDAGYTKVGSNQHVVVVMLFDDENAVILDIKNNRYQKVNKNCLAQNLNKRGMKETLKNQQRYATVAWQNARKVGDQELINKCWEAKVLADSLV